MFGILSIIGLYLVFIVKLIQFVIYLVSFLVSMFT